MTPTWRKPFGMFVILALILVWVVLIGSLSGLAARWHPLLQLGFYGVTGMIWIAPLKPLLAWMETGRWR